MKIKEICAQTGLSQRAVRFYEERGLLHPKTTENNGRDYRQYSQSDVERLREIAALRGVDFSIEEIQTLYLRPKETRKLLEAHLDNLRREAERQEAAIRLLAPFAQRNCSGGEELARALLEQQGRSLSAAEPDFGKNDGLAPEEKAALGRAARERIDRKGRLTRRAAALAGAIILLAAGLLGYHFWQNSRSISLYSTLSGGYFSDQRLVETAGGKMLMTARVSFPQGPSFLAVFRGETGNALYNSLFLNQEYAGVSFVVEIPRKEAEKLGLISGNFAEKVYEMILPDDGLCMEYLSVAGLQGDYQ